MVERSRGWLPPREGGYKAVDEAGTKGTYKIVDEAGKEPYKLFEAGTKGTYKIVDEAGKGPYRIFEAGKIGTYKIVDEAGKEAFAAKSRPVPPKDRSGISRPTNITKG